MPLARPTLPQLHTLRETAAVLRMSTKTLQRRLKSGALQGYSEGGRTLIAASEIAAYLARNKQSID